ncbi:MAG: CDP-alcohol phosphatidyltransferase family protein [Alteromonadaceae bacterium]|jgi:phosphatidylglycerophosphate synthase|uniref:Membrane protein n=2 Tax=Paraglaciecola chathamensis TaxID=368405 RepID=A0A8H9IGP5_9ALTE|nr:MULTISPECIES: CDP-alcohol phosphatidyltransferase family protein [Paraglaciecola]MBN24656.1 CDP-alcohol phosphatidyltransferase family protein [Alteromonadaceae bacterium]MDO6560649.1 CDP-alcohol phosphatidyltransferase family protein [Paraglaciecola chathamensis]MDO6841869.1 CDP-alcohol phosphatidyltransferase family protein [Paraglaciecola chathamensis]GAC06390.1 inner membrane protein ynjF [Paraglaciecola agarilytica NO2]GGZ75750.1 membrane protein [Paraglaciecola oceanifecundans]|tara:strand:- start:57344 stop:57958 length:615 start_codon:yes stop_codon:yes gene_type:complete
MFDPLLNKVLKKPLCGLAKQLIKRGVSADKVTVVGFIVGMLAVPAIIYGHYTFALCLILLNRLGDGLDGAIARETSPSDAGGFLDITLDFIFYSAIVFAFVCANPVQNAVAGSFLMLSFMGTGGSFLAFAIMASKHGIDSPNYPQKSLHYMGGLAEGFETILVLCLFCLFPSQFVIIASVFAVICWLTAAIRIWVGYNTLVATK